MKKKLHLLTLTAALMAHSGFLIADDEVAIEASSDISEQPTEKTENVVSSSEQRKKDPCEYVHEKLSNKFDISVNIPPMVFVPGYTSVLLQKFEECMKQKESDSLTFQLGQTDQLLANISNLYDQFDTETTRFDSIVQNKQELTHALKVCDDKNQRENIKKAYVSAKESEHKCFGTMVSISKKADEEAEKLERHLKDHNLLGLQENLQVIVAGLNARKETLEYMEQKMLDRMDG